jgi:hypothetical protein
MGKAGGHDFKIHLKKQNEPNAACNTIAGFYQPLLVTDDLAKVTCGRCTRKIFFNKQGGKK